MTDSSLRPRLKVSNVISLQDARSSAAVGMDMISFNLERGNPRKLSASMVWNMVQWLSGPEIVLEMNVESLSELTDIQQYFKPSWVSLPIEAWGHAQVAEIPALILRCDESAPQHQLLDILTQREADTVLFEVSLAGGNVPEYPANVRERVLWQFPAPEAVETLIRRDQPLPWGFSFYDEIEEEPGVMDYERIDALLEVFEDRFPRS